MRSRWPALALAASTVVAAVACRQLVGIGDEPPQSLAAGADAGDSGAAGDATDAGSPLVYSGACGSCVDASCAGQAAACAASASCVPYASCLAACNGDATCRAQCTAAGLAPAASPELDDLSACLVASCAGPCGLACGALAGYYATPDAAAACEQCQVSNYCDAETTCASAPTCHAFVRCVLGCQGRYDCLQACYEDDSGAVDTYGYDYGLGSCTTICGMGRNWECAGRVGWPAPAGTSSTVTLVMNGALGASAAGLDVSFCSGPVGCGAVGPPGVTDDAGTVSLQVPTPSYRGPTGFLRVVSPDDAGAQAVVPESSHWGFGLSEPSLTLYTTAYSPAIIDALAAQLHVSLDPSRGYVLAVVWDCLHYPGIGVQVDCSGCDSETVRAYQQATGGYSLTATATDSTGGVIFGNVPSVPVDLIATPQDLGKPTARVTVQVQPGTLTIVLMSPTP